MKEESSERSKRRGMPKGMNLLIKVLSAKNLIIINYFSEKFVTAAYKQKMIEIEEQEKEEKLQDLKESIMDVTKQKDMSGFYKYVLYLN